MGITLKSKNRNTDMGYSGFGHFRKRVATLSGDIFGKHYDDLKDGRHLPDDELDAFYEQYDAKTNKLIAAGSITIEIANFCYQSDAEGEIDQSQAQQIYKKIKDYDDNLAYGYIGRPDCTTFSDLKAIFKDCAENGDTIKWR